MCSMCRPHPGSHSCPWEAGGRAHDTLQIIPPPKNPNTNQCKTNSLAWTPLGPGGQEHYFTSWHGRERALKPKPVLSFISSLCVTLDKSAYLWGSVVAFLAKEGDDLWGVKKKKNVPWVGAGHIQSGSRLGGDCGRRASSCSADPGPGQLSSRAGRAQVGQMSPSDQK